MPLCVHIPDGAMTLWLQLSDITSKLSHALRPPTTVSVYHRSGWLAERKGLAMSATASLDVDTDSVPTASTSLAVDDLVIVEDEQVVIDEAVQLTAEMAVPAPTLSLQDVAIAERKAIMPFIYLGVVSFSAIVALSAVLAFG